MNDRRQPATYKWRVAHKDHLAAYNRTYQLQVKAEVMAQYGGSCAQCGEARVELLSLHHTRFDGQAHRLKITGNPDRSGLQFYLRLRKLGFPDKSVLQVLCLNCHHLMRPYTRKRIYLAGTMTHDWRGPIRRRLEDGGAVVWLPADNPQQSAALYVPKDLAMASVCDALLAYIHPGHSARGTHAEMGVAFAHHNPVWLIWKDGPQPYSFSAALAYKVFTDIEPAVDDLLEFVRKGVLL